MFLVFIFEVLVVVLMDEKDYSCLCVLVILGILLVVFLVFCVFLFGFVIFFMEFISYVGVFKLFFDIVYDVFYDIILLLNGLLICLFVSYCWKCYNLYKVLEIGLFNYKGSWFECYVDILVGIFILFILVLIFINIVVVKYFGIILFGWSWI